MSRLGSPTAAQVAGRADELEARIDDPSNVDDPRWLRRTISILRQVAAKKEKAFAHKQAQRHNRHGQRRSI